jgi:hypothetical protein
MTHWLTVQSAAFETMFCLLQKYEKVGYLQLRAEGPQLLVLAKQPPAGGSAIQIESSHVLIATEITRNSSHLSTCR